jgi:hypothetical protein
MFNPFLLSFNSIRTKQEVKRGHPNGNARCHLLTDDTLVAIGKIPTDFKATIHRSWVHNDCIWFCVAQGGFVDPKGHVVLAGGWKERFVHPFQLETKHHHDIGASKTTLKRIVNGHWKLVDIAWHQRVRSDQVYIGAKRRQTPNI